MFGRNKRLEAQTEYRLTCLENPYRLSIKDKVYGVYLWGAEKNFISKGKVVRCRRDDSGYPVYDVYFKKECEIIDRLPHGRIITEKPKEK